MFLQPLYPVDEVAIIGTGRALYFHMALDWSGCVFFQPIAILGRERPACALVQCPVFVANPTRCLIRVSASCPVSQQAVKPPVAVTEGFLGNDGAVVVGPAGDDWVQLPNQRFLERRAVLVYHL